MDRKQQGGRTVWRLRIRVPTRIEELYQLAHASIERGKHYRGETLSLVFLPGDTAFAVHRRL
jgi:hypothetical protein